MLVAISSHVLVLIVVNWSLLTKIHEVGKFIIAEALVPPSLTKTLLILTSHVLRCLLLMFLELLIVRIVFLRILWVSSIFLR